MPRGGYRPGAGRKKKNLEGVATISFCLPKGMDARVRKLFTRIGETYSSHLKKHFELRIEELEKRADEEGL